MPKLVDKFPSQAKKRRSETLKSDSIVVSSRSVRICSAKRVRTLILDQNKDKESSEDEGPLHTLGTPLPNRKRKRVFTSSSEDEPAVADSRQKKHAKQDDSRLTGMEEEVRYSLVLKDKIITLWQRTLFPVQIRVRWPTYRPPS